MNQRTRTAVSACARTLSGASDADVALASSDATTVGPFRAQADRLALQRRYLTTLTLERRPQAPNAAALYDALVHARLDAIGARWLAGIRENLLAFPGRDDDGVRWVAFAAFSNVTVPREKAALAERARAALTAALLSDLQALGAGLYSESAFVAAAAAWSEKASGIAPAPVAAIATRGFNIPSKPAGVDLRRGRYALPGADAKRASNREAQTDGEGGAAPPKPKETLETIGGYRAFTTTHDQIVNAAALASRDDLAHLRAELDADFRPLRAMVARLSKRLMRELMARQAREWRFDLDEGWLDQSRLTAFIASRGSARPFKWEFESRFPSTVISLLIDHSGSMKGRPMKIAALTVEIFARVLERCGVACEVLGFTTRDWDGGEPAREWAASGYPEHPGRLNALQHIVIKPASMPWRRARLALGLFLHNEMLKENIDGEALAWAHQRLQARSERRKILVVVSDGAPMDEATCAANGFDYLDTHLSAVVKQIELRSPVKLAAIGIGHNVSQFYSNATRISKIDDLGPALAAKLTALLTDETAT